MRYILIFLLLITTVQAQDTVLVPSVDAVSMLSKRITQLEAQITLIQGLASRVDKLDSDLELSAKEIISLIEEIRSLKLRVTALEPIVPPPPPDPEPEPPTPEPTNQITVADFKLIGGIRLNETFSGGGLAIDFDGGIIYQGGHDQGDYIITHQLPEIGLGEPGEKHANWPMAVKLGQLEPWHKDQPYGTSLKIPDHNNGLDFRDGKLWVSSRVKYDTSASNRGIVLMSNAGDKISVPLQRSAFGGGFIDGHPEWLLGCGGYRSGQGSKAGPTVAKPDGTILLDAAVFNNMDFAARTPRAGGSWNASGKDQWYSFMPRKADGTITTIEEATAGIGTGAWNSDTLYDGGIWTPRGLCFFPMMGMGLLDYAYQSPQFAGKGASRPFLYTYDPVTFAFQKYESWPYGDIRGCEVGPDGRIYLMRFEAWNGTYGQPYSAIYVFEAIK